MFLIAGLVQSTLYQEVKEDEKGSESVVETTGPFISGAKYRIQEIGNESCVKLMDVGDGVTMGACNEDSSSVWTIAGDAGSATLKNAFSNECLIFKTFNIQDIDSIFCFGCTFKTVELYPSILDMGSCDGDKHNKWMFNLAKGAARPVTLTPKDFPKKPLIHHYLEGRFNGLNFYNTPENCTNVNDNIYFKLIKVDG